MFWSSLYRIFAKRNYNNCTYIFTAIFILPLRPEGSKWQNWFYTFYAPPEKSTEQGLAIDSVTRIAPALFYLRRTPKISISLLEL